MKKSILLSIAASAVMFAGGDLVPIEPAAPATADFWGQIGFFYQAEDRNAPLAPDHNWGDEFNNWFNATVVLGAEKQFSNGFGFGAEVAGWTDFGADLGDRTLFKTDTTIAGLIDPTSAEVSQAYMTYVTGNTAIKAGRQALPKAVSPWAWSDRTGGVVDISYDGVVIANTDITDTTLVAGWVDQASFSSDTASNVDVSDKYGLYMISVINKSLANTTIALSGYYIPKSELRRNGFRNTLFDTWSIWASAEGNTGLVNWGVQAVYIDGDAVWRNSRDDVGATAGVAAKVGSSWGDADAELVAAYINDGGYSMKTAGSGRGTSAFWSNNGDYGGDVKPGEAQWSLMAKAGYNLAVGKVYGNVGYWDFDARNYGAYTLDNAIDAIAGYKFDFSGINANIEYRYLNESFTDRDDRERQRVRVEAYYKF